MKSDKLEDKTLTQCDADADTNTNNRGDYNSSTVLRTDELKMTCAPSKDSDQPGIPHSLISLRCAL